MDGDDLDEELARLEQEIDLEAAGYVEGHAQASRPPKAVMPELSSIGLEQNPIRRHLEEVEDKVRYGQRKLGTATGQYASQSSSGPGLQPTRMSHRVSSSGAPDNGVIVASSEPVIIKKPPEWQLELIRRDYERIHGKQLDAAADKSTVSGTHHGLSQTPLEPSRPSKQENAHISTQRLSSESRAHWSIRHIDELPSAKSAQGSTPAWVSIGAEAPLPHRVAREQMSFPSIQDAMESVRGAQVLGGVPAGPVMPPQKSVHGQSAPGPGRRKARDGRLRTAAGSVWEDPTLDQWPEDDFRIFVGDLASDATDDELKEAFQKYPSFNMARIVVDKRTGTCKGYGFVSFSKGEDMSTALREMNGKYVGSRPVKLKKSTWQKRELTSQKRNELKVLKSAGCITKSHAKRP